MPDIAKHHSKEERERDTCEECWVKLLVARYVEEVDYELKGSSEFICYNVSWRTNFTSVIFWIEFIESWHLKILWILLVEIVQCLHRLVDLKDRDPAKAE